MSNWSNPVADSDRDPDPTKERAPDLTASATTTLIKRQLQFFFSLLVDKKALVFPSFYQNEEI